MIDRTQRLLLTVLAVQLALILVVWAPWSSDAAATASQELFPELDSAGIVRIEIEQADGRVTLSRGPDGWTVDERASFPADADRVGELIDDVAEVRARVPVVRSSRYHDALGVGDGEFEARVRLTGDGDEHVVADVLLGTSPNVGLRHLRLADDDRVYEVRGFDRWSVRSDPDAWIDKNLLPDVTVESVRRITIENEHGAMIAARGEDGAWVVEEGVGETDVASLVEDIVGLRLLEPAGDDAPAFDPIEADAIASLEVTVEDGPSRTVRIHVGPELSEDDDRRIVLRTEPQRRVVVSAYDAARILDLGAEDDEGATIVGQ